MKKFFLIFIAVFFFPVFAHASWYKIYDDPVAQSNGYFVIYSTDSESPDVDPTGNWLGYDGGWVTNLGGGGGQDSIDLAYGADPLRLPNNTNGSDSGLTWPCGWSQYSQACPFSYSFDIMGNIKDETIDIMPQNLAAVAGSMGANLWVVLSIICGVSLGFWVLDWVISQFNTQKKRDDVWDNMANEDLDDDIKDYKKLGDDIDIVLEKTREMNHLSDKS